MAMPGGDGRSGPVQASAPGGAGDTSLLGSATTWPLKRYGRFLPPTDGDGEEQNTSSWKVFESNEESGHLILTIVISGHFFISHGRTVLSMGYPADTFIHDIIQCVCSSSTVNSEKTLLFAFHEPIEGFSLIDSHKWLKILRRADCLLLRVQAKNECRMFRVQFGGDSRAQMLDHCCSCVQKLAEYVPVEVTDEQSQNLYPSLPQPANGDSQPDEPPPDSCTSLEERRSVTQLAQSVLRKEPQLPLVSRHPAWPAQELGPFIRLCLMDQDFPAFVEDVEKELKKLTEG